MTTLTTLDQRKQLQEVLQTELLKRGFLAPIKEVVESEGRRGGNYLEFETENFQTTPVIFKQINVANFNSTLREEFVENENGKFRVLRFWMTISARYTNFDGGTNGSNIFAISGEFFGTNGLDFKTK